MNRGYTSKSGTTASIVDSSVDQKQSPQQVDAQKIGSAPMLLLMAGFAGAGKTTLAQQLSRALGWKILDKDALQRSFLAQGMEKDIAGWNAFEELLKLIQEALSQGESVIIDTSNERPFVFERTTAMLEQTRRQHQVDPDYMVLFCLADEHERTKRLKIRGSSLAPYHEELPFIPPDSQLQSSLGHLLPPELRGLLAKPLPFLASSPLLHKEQALLINTIWPLPSYVELALTIIKNRCGINPNEAA